MNDEEFSEPVLAWKWALLRPETDGRMSLSGLGYGVYRVDDVASCMKGEKHLAPAEHCTCGFWTVEELENLPSVVAYQPGYVLMRVETFGRVVVHERGLRSERQRVLEVFLPATCQRCSRPTSGVDLGPQGILVPACTKHLLVNVSDVASRLGTEVSVVRETHAPAFVEPPAEKRSRHTRALGAQDPVWHNFMQFLLLGAVLLLCLWFFGRGLTTAAPVDSSIPYNNEVEALYRSLDNGPEELTTTLLGQDVNVMRESLGKGLYAVSVVSMTPAFSLKDTEDLVCLLLVPTSVLNGRTKVLFDDWEAHGVLTLLSQPSDALDCQNRIDTATSLLSRSAARTTTDSTPA